MNRLSAITASNLLCVLHKVGLPRDRLSRMRHLVYRKVLRRPERTFHTRLADYAEHRLQKSLANFAFILDGKSPRTSLIEFGTGAMGTDLAVAYLLGYANIITCDINDHLEFENFSRIVRKVEGSLEYISKHFEVPAGKIQDRWDLLRHAESKEHLYRLGIINFLPFSRLLQTPLPTIDLWYSESTLQRVPAHLLGSYSKHVADNLAEDALVFHKLDLADIYTQPHYPFYIPSAHRFDFLKYQEWLWNIMNNDLYSSQNRFRIPQYLEIFGRLGLHLQHARFVRYASDEDYLKEMRLPEAFSRYSAHDLSIAHAKLLMTPGIVDSPIVENFEVPEDGDFLALNW